MRKRGGVVDGHHGPELYGDGADSDQPEALAAAPLVTPGTRPSPSARAVYSDEGTPETTGVGLLHISFCVDRLHEYTWIVSFSGLNTSRLPAFLNKAGS